jgi:phosphoglycerate-specific signal transduction histidine kinase
MDKETLEALKGIVKEAIKEEIEGLTEVVTDGFEYLNNKVDKEVAALRSEMKGMEKTLKDEISAVAMEVLEVKQLVRRIDDRTQHQTEALYEEVRITQKEVANLQDHLGLPRSFPAAA